MPDIWKIAHVDNIVKNILKGLKIWNAKLTETEIFRELSIEIESSLFN